MIVGVPGMGNAEPSWHQRQPFGFSKSGRGRAQARIQTLRRPSTACARLGNEHNSHTQKAITAERTTYWGNGDDGVGGGDAQDLTIRGVPTPYHSALRFSEGNKMRARPATVRHQRSSFMSPRGNNAESMIFANRLSTKAAATITSGVVACTRNRAGIIRNGRDGRTAPPPTPPPQTPPSSSDPRASKEPTSPPYRPSPDAIRRRRPSTAGSSRPTPCHFESIGVPTRAVDDFAHGFGCAPRHGTEVRQSSTVWHSASGAKSMEHPARIGGEAAPKAIDMYASESKENVYVQGKASRSKSIQQQPPMRPLNDQLVKAGHNVEMKGSTFHQSIFQECPGNVQQPVRRRPLSAAPTRTRNHTDINGYGGDRIGIGGWGSANGVRGVGSDRDRAVDSGRRVRPRSASAIGVRHFAEQNPRDRVEYNGAPTNQNRKRCASVAVPDFVVSEKQVLRFGGYLSEELAWGCENLPRDVPRALKIRQVVLSFFLADGSLEIFEKRQVNSGEQGGLLVKRNLFKKQDGSYYGFRDLKVGTDFKLLGKLFRLMDCDDYTRSWYSSQGFEQPEAEAAPEQISESLRVEHTTGLGNPFRPCTTSSPLSSVGGLTAEFCARQWRHEKARRFHRHDKEVLRFRAVWDDPSVGGVRRRYDVLFYLQDETIAVMNLREDRKNSGRDEGAVYVRRQRLPRNWKFRDSADDRDIDIDNDNHVKELDLYVGGSVNVWGRKIRLVGCDPFTKEYYQSEHGVDMELNLGDAAAERTRNKALRMHRRPGATYKYHLGGHCQQQAGAGAKSTAQQVKAEGLFGGQVRCGCCRRSGKAYTTIGGALPPDRFKGRRVRCKAALNSSHPNDIGREFVITYDLGWDTIMVYELQQRNSGRPGGLFLAKGKHRRPSNKGKERYYAPQDLFLGANLPLVTGHTLVVTEMDRSSLALCEEFPREFPLMDCERVLGKVATRARQMNLNLRRELYHRAEMASVTTSSGWVPKPAVTTIGASIAPQPPAATMMLSGRTAGKSFAGARSPQQSTNANGGDQGEGSGLVIAEGRRARSGATWGLVGGWDDRHSVSGGLIASMGGTGVHNSANKKSTSVKAAGPTVEGGRVRATIGGSIEQGPVVAFEDERGFRDAMDELGLLVGLGQQEVLTLIRSLIDQQGGGRRVFWAIMCDRISQVSVAAGIENNLAGIDAGVFSSELLPSQSPYDDGEATSGTVLRRMRKTDVEWRTIFSLKETSLSSTPMTSNRLHLNGILGVASLVQVLRRNGIEMDVRDASFLVRRFGRGGGSQVDYNSLCDAVYPCNFSRNKNIHCRGSITSNKNDSGADTNDDNIDGTLPTPSCPTNDHGCGANGARRSRSVFDRSQHPKNSPGLSQAVGGGGGWDNGGWSEGQGNPSYWIEDVQERGAGECFS